MNDPRTLSMMGARVLGEPSQEEMVARMQEMQRTAMIENFRQSAALQCMIAMTIAAVKDSEDSSAVPRAAIDKAADQAKYAADVLVNRMFAE